jgi:hypothetical protein
MKNWPRTLPWFPATTRIEGHDMAMSPEEIHEIDLEDLADLRGDVLVWDDDDWEPC